MSQSAKVDQAARTPDRVEAIDQFRGLAIFLMVLADYLNNIPITPAWLKHAPDIGYTIIDLIAPLFIFAIGLTYGLSFQRRYARQGAWRTYEHFITRNLALIGLGFLIILGGSLSKLADHSINWGLLPALGMAGLITLLVIRLPSSWRWVIGLALLGVYQVLLERYWLKDVVAATHNGPWGSLSWGAMLILSTAMADLFYEVGPGRRAFPWVAVFVTGIGIGLGYLAPISKHQASASYNLLSLGLSALVFYLLFLVNNQLKIRLPTLTEWGRNALLLYLLHGIFIGLLIFPIYYGWISDIPVWFVVLEAFILLGILSWIGHYLDKRGLYFVL
jgi:predicted acyltransferase